MNSETSFTELREKLLKQKVQIQAEINSYPAPIAGCDQQFNFLLERRSAVRRQLHAVEQELAKATS